MHKVQAFIDRYETVSLDNSIHRFCLEKVRLTKAGVGIEDFDLLIATTAVANDMIVVTSNMKHFARVENIQLVDWTK